MRIILGSALTYGLTFAVPAFSATLVATHPGVMCSSADALAKLSLPDGSSRASSPNARPQDLTTKQNGGCVDFGPGTQVTVVVSRKNTSVVTFDAGDGHGQREFTVPNVDFALAGGPPPAPGQHVPQFLDADYPPMIGMNKLLAAVTKQCPQQGWTGHKLANTESGPWWDAIKLTRAQSAVVGKAQAECEGYAGMTCPAYTSLGVEVQMGYLPRLVTLICSQKAPAE